MTRRFNTSVTRSVQNDDPDSRYSFKELEVHEDASVRIVGENHGFFRVPMVELRQQVATIEELGTDYPSDYFIVKTKKDQKYYQVPEGTIMDVDSDRAYRRMNAFLLKVDAYDIDRGITYIVMVPDEDYGATGHLERWEVDFPSDS